MTIVNHHKMHYERLLPYTRDRSMLMLGATTIHPQFYPPEEWFGLTSYQSLDPDGGDITRSLTEDLSDMYEQFGVVWNLGTIEHIWDVHSAYSNAAKLVEVGGYFIGHAPVVKYRGHGICVAEDSAIMAFFAKNGFEHVEHWHMASQLGEIMWHVEKKVESRLGDLDHPTQIFDNNKKTPIV
jgi:hypothetical protein